MLYTFSEIRNNEVYGRKDEYIVRWKFPFGTQTSDPEQKGHRVSSGVEWSLEKGGGGGAREFRGQRLEVGQWTAESRAGEMSVIIRRYEVRSRETEGSK